MVRKDTTKDSPILRIKNLTKSYKISNGEVEAVKGVNFSVDRGEIVGILGPNGAGKTTLIKCILGLVTPTDGSIEIGEIDPDVDKSAAFEQVSAVLEGARNVYWRLTVRENLRFFAGLHGQHPNSLEERYDQLISMVGLDEKGNTQVRRLSRGMQQKASLATSLVQNTDLLFLDEPTLGLDVEAAVDLRSEIKRLAEEEDRTILLSSHDMDVVQELCHRVIILNDGKIVANDTVENLINVFQTQTYEVTFQDDMEPAESLDEFAIETLPNRALPTVKVTLKGSNELYEFIIACRDADATIKRIESAEPDLEEVFLEVIDKNGSKATARTGTQP